MVVSRAIHFLLALVLSCSVAISARADSLASFLPDIDPADLAPGADAFGPVRSDVKVAPVLRGGETIAWAFLTSDFVGTTGYSGKPIHVVAAIDADAVLTGVQLVKHSEPIVLIGIPNSRMVELTEGYAGLDLKREAETGGEGHDLDIISGAGHDACWINRVAPTAMVMCPCVDGLSHNEAEEITPEWAEKGCNVLFHAVVETAEIVE